MEDNKKVDEREYDQLDALTSSPSIEISRLSLIIKDMRQRMESLEKNQTDLMDIINENHTCQISRNTLLPSQVYHMYFYRNIHTNRQREKERQK